MERPRIVPPAAARHTPPAVRTPATTVHGGRALLTHAGGVALVSIGLGPTAMLIAGVSGLVFLFFLFVLERRGERILPLSETAAAHRLQEENTIGGAGTLAGKIVVKPAAS